MPSFFNTTAKKKSAKRNGARCCALCTTPTTTHEKKFEEEEGSKGEEEGAVRRRYQQSWLMPFFRSPEETRERWARFCHMTTDFDIASWAHNCLQLWDWRDRGDGRVWYLQTTSAYAVRKAAMRRLRDQYLEAIDQGRPFDTHMTYMSAEVQWFALRPALSMQRPSYSDVAGRKVNYGC